MCHVEAPADRLVTLAELSALTGASHGQVIAMARTGRLPAPQAWRVGNRASPVWSARALAAIFVRSALEETFDGETPIAGYP